MRLYRLEKINKVTEWFYAILRAIGVALIVTVGIMMLNGYKFMIVSSGSMEPELPVGSLIIVTPCEYDELKYGDIVTFKGGEITFTHRVVGKTDVTGQSLNEETVLTPGEEGYEEASFWVTKGDYEGAKYDGALTKEVVGKVNPAHAFTFVGLIVRYVRANYMMVIVSMVILIGFVGTINFLKEKLYEDDINCYENDEEE